MAMTDMSMKAMEHDALCLHSKQVQIILNYWDCTYCYLIRRVRAEGIELLWTDNEL